jgi:phytol kinase
MLLVLLTLFITFLILVLNEIYWRTRHTYGEFSRKFVHITVGCYVAFWPFYLSWHQIEGLSVAFFIVVFLSERFKIFAATQSVQRLTWGQLFFATSVGLIALMTHDKWIYSAALLQMALADGLAAIVGIRYGKRSSYRILGHTKSIIGTITFFIVSLAVLLSFSHFGKIHLGLAWIVLSSLMACLLENIAAYGLDNILVPVVVAFLLIHH